MALILDTNNDVIIADTAADLTQQLLELLTDDPDEETLVKLAAAVLGCDVLDIVLTRTENDPRGQTGG